MEDYRDHIVRVLTVLPLGEPDTIDASRPEERT